MRVDEKALAERVRRLTGARSAEVSARLQALWGGYGELFRVELSGHAEASVIVKWIQPPRGESSRSHRRKLRSYEVERAFYARYAGRLSGACRVPRALGLHADANGSLFVLEDLDQAGFGVRKRRVTPGEIRCLLGWLARFHAEFLGEAPEGLWKVGTYWHLATRPDELAVMRHPALKRVAPVLDARLNAARFRTFVHGDAKLENALFASDGDDVAFVDFQYVGGGVGVKDVAYLLGCCLTSREQPALVPTYLDAYFEELRRALAARRDAIDCAELEREWRALLPLAWLDFHRFLLGWAPGSYDSDPYAEALLREHGQSLGE